MVGINAKHSGRYTKKSSENATDNRQCSDNFVSDILQEAQLPLKRQDVSYAFLWSSVTFYRRSYRNLRPMNRLIYYTYTGNKIKLLHVQHVC